MLFRSSGQIAHAGALLVLEKLPAAHGAHRAGDRSLALATNVPGVHGCGASQNGWPGLSWNVLSGQPVQLGALVVSLKDPAAQRVQMRFATADGAVDTKVPGPLSVHCWQIVSIDAVPGSDANDPSPQLRCGVHFSA